MYYDRRLPPALLDLLEPTGPLGWMVRWVHSPMGEANLAHVQFRKAAGVRVKGGIQLYLGRTSPLEVIGKPKGYVELIADEFYQQVTPELFGRRMPVAELQRITAAVEAHVRDCTKITNKSFLDGEAIANAGMMRRYGIGHMPTDPVLVVDSEVQVGFGLIAERVQFERTLRIRLCLSQADVLPRKLDALGILVDGNIGVIEVKREQGDLHRAAVQAAAHICTLKQLGCWDG